MEAPCKNCKNRTTPKSCETSCKLWQDYKSEKEKQLKNARVRKSIEKRINENIWRNKKWN